MYVHVSLYNYCERALNQLYSFTPQNFMVLFPVYNYYINCEFIIFILVKIGGGVPALQLWYIINNNYIIIDEVIKIKVIISTIHYV